MENEVNENCHRNMWLKKKISIRSIYRSKTHLANWKDTPSIPQRDLFLLKLFSDSCIQEWDVNKSKKIGVITYVYKNTYTLSCVPSSPDLVLIYSPAFFPLFLLSCFHIRSNLLRVFASWWQYCLRRVFLCSCRARRFFSFSLSVFIGMVMSGCTIFSINIYSVICQDIVKYL